MADRERSFTLSGRSAQQGFTLIEIMVALMVFSLAALALIRLEGATLRSAGLVDRTVVAELVARNVAIEGMTDAQPPVLGPTSGVTVNAGQNWYWTRNVAPAGGGLLRIDVVVAGRGGQQLGRATVIRPPARPAPSPVSPTPAPTPGAPL